MPETEEKNILLSILDIAEDCLKCNEGLDKTTLAKKLQEKYPLKSKDLINHFLDLYYPENFNYINKKSWLSSDGNIRLLQYKSIAKSEANLEAATQSLEEAKTQNNTAKKSLFWSRFTLIIAVVTMICTIIFPLPFIQNCINKKNVELQKQSEQKKLELLEQVVFKQDSIIHSLEKLQQSIINSPSNISKDSVGNKKNQNTITTIPKKK